MDPEASMGSADEFSDAASSDGDRLSDDECFDCIQEEDHRESLTDDLVVVPNAVLTERDIVQRTSQEAAAMAELFSVPADWALALLVHYHWNPLRLQDDWFADHARVRDAVGLGDAAVPGGEEIVTCAICTEDKPAEETASAGCAHRYCHDCWRGYVAAALEDGGGAAARCLALRCPDASCSRAVLRGMLERFAAADGRGAYARALARAFVDGRRRRLKPCTAPGCGRFIEIELAPGGGGGGGDSDLACRCGNAFCWRCGGAAHWPASCAAVARWAHEADAASADWILLHTKPCPRCRRPIERARWGCNRMVCAPPCQHFFCWGCLGEPVLGRLAEHDMCGKFRFQEQPATEERVRAELALDRFLYYQDLWMASLRKRRDAEAELRKLRVEEEKLPPERRAATAEHRRIVAAALETVAEGRRVLGNACAHGQVLREVDPARQELFEYQRGEADEVVEELRRRAMAWPEPEKMVEVGAELAKLTRETRRRLENFAKAVEEGLPELGATASSSKSDSG